MNVMDKLMTAVRSGARELGEAVVDSQSLRIFEQEIEDSKAGLLEAKQGLTEIIARKMASERRLAQVTIKIGEHEGYVLKALEQSKETLALQISEKIAKLETEQAEAKLDIESYSQNVDRLKAQIKSAEKIIAEHERQLAVVQTQESVHLARKSVTHTVVANDSAIGNARESLERIKQKQQHAQDRLEAGVDLRKELDDDDLETKLKESGIKQEENPAEAVLARLKAKNQT